MSALRDVVDASERIVFFGGAGVSTESGIPDFRSADGLYRKESGTRVPPEEVLSHTFFVRHPDEFFAYYRANLIHSGAQPNDAHRALASLEQDGRLSAVVTQNIDGLHQVAGSRRVIELHGSVHRNQCVRCGRRCGLDAILTIGVPRCGCGGVIRPDVVLYEEPLDEQVMADAASEIAGADTLIVGGTSLAVYPAAGFLTLFRGDNLILINRDPTPYDARATLVLRSSIGRTLAPFISHGQVVEPA